jgi:hypothetical protein
LEKKKQKALVTWRTAVGRAGSKRIKPSASFRRGAFAVVCSQKEDASCRLPFSGFQVGGVKQKNFIRLGPALSAAGRHLTKNFCLF